MTQLNLFKNENAKVLIPLGGLITGILITVVAKKNYQRAIGIILAGAGAIELLSSFTSVKKKVRLIFWGGSREKNKNGTKNSYGIGDNGAFYHSGKNVKSDYSDFDEIGEMLKITSAKNLVNKLNSQQDNSIHTLDILSHGTPYSLNFSQKENENCGLYTSWFAKKSIELFYTLEDREKYSFTDDARRLDDIAYKKFSKDARIEIHGCNTANDLNLPLDTFIETMSELLYEAGKIHAVVIGHTTKANPKINGENTPNEEQDYRHGERVVFHNGSVLFTTTKKEMIGYSLIHQRLKEKLGNEY